MVLEMAGYTLQDWSSGENKPYLASSPNFTLPSSRVSLCGNTLEMFYVAAL